MKKWAIIILVLLFIFGGVYYFKFYKSNNKLSANKQYQNTTDVHPTEEIKDPQADLLAIDPNWTVYIQEESVGSFNRYFIAYPPEWKRNVEHDESGVIDILTLSKNNYNITITQGDKGGHQCVFEGEVPNTVPVVDYRKSTYKEVESVLGTLRRVKVNSNVPSQVKLYFCIKDQNANTFRSPTKVGDVSYTVPSGSDEKILTEMDRIVRTLRIFNSGS